jgi:H+-transporting ATPase
MQPSQTKGLTTLEVKKLHESYGYNDISEKTESGVTRFLKKFIAPIPLMIEGALLLSAIARRWEDFSIIFVLLAINIIVDFLQEQKASTALKALRDTLDPTSLTLRDGDFEKIDIKDLVPGDIVKINIGDIVPADSILIDDTIIDIDQSSTTGESLPVEKKKGDTLFASSIIQKGLAIIKITAIGKNSSIGKNADLVSRAEHENKNHFEKAIFGISKFLIILSVVLIIIVFTTLILRGGSLIESIRFILVLAIASIPVALPAVLSVTLAIGAAALAKKKAIISNFKSIEELAGIDILCVDKTGTLTKNKLSVTSPKSYENFNLSDLFTYALLASDKEHVSNIEKTIYSYAKENNLIEKINSYNIDKFSPFNPTKKTTEVFVHTDTEKFEIIMGAPQVVMGIIAQDTISNILSNDILEFAKNGFRTIAVAKKIGSKFSLVGIIPLIDPPRDDSKSVVSQIHKLGVRIKMLTGDNSAIATFISKTLNIGSNITKGSILREKLSDGASDDEMKSIMNTDIFAEVIPEDKYNIIDALQKHGHIVAMTGDGVNDAPALKKADIGIAVSGSSQAAQSAADIVLLDNGLSIIKNAINNARMIFMRMQSYATFRISETIRIIFFITLSILIFNYSPISAVMIILLALLNDIPIMTIAYDNVPIDKAPVRWHLNETILISTILGFTGLISSFGLFYWLNMNGYEIIIIQTILFVKLDVSGHSTLYLTRTGRKHFWQRPFPSLKFFIPAFGTRIIGTLIGVFGIFVQAISWKTVGYIWIYATIWFLINDQIKVFSYYLFDRFRKQ